MSKKDRGWSHFCPIDRCFKYLFIDECDCGATRIEYFRLKKAKRIAEKKKQN